MQGIAVSHFNFIDGVKQKIEQDITIYDTTLRDGEQMPGVSFSIQQKVDIARKLAELGVRQIEAGFPAVSENECEAVKAVASTGTGAEVLVLSRLNRKDIDISIDCGADMVLLFIGSSELHMKYKLKMSKYDILSLVTECVEYVKERGVKASFSTEDSTRAELDFLLGLNKAAEEAGAVRIGITDTTGCASPEAIGYLVLSVKENTKCAVSIHLHNDFGLALANALSGIIAGADAVATTSLGIGERAGNVPLEDFVMACHFLYQKEIGVDTTKLKSLSELTSLYSGYSIPPNKPWVGDNAFAHESGIHVAAVLNCPLTYECVSPEIVGNRRRIILGKHTGTSLIRNRLKEKGIELSQDVICDIVREIKRRGETKGRIRDSEFWEIVEKFSLGKQPR